MQFASTTSVQLSPVNAAQVQQSLLRRMVETRDKGEQLRWCERLSRAREWSHNRSMDDLRFGGR
jgi:hypothetical protein